MPIKGTFVTRSWVSGGWASPSGVQPCSPENGKNLVQTLCREINCVFNAGLCTEPIMDSVSSPEAEEGRKPKFLVIGGSHALQEAEVLAAKGFDVVTCAVSGWRANKTASEEMAEKVQEALKDFCEDDVVVVHCCDNTAFMARTEDGDTSLSGGSSLETTTLKGTWWWRARRGSLCFSKTVSLF